MNVAPHGSVFRTQGQPVRDFLVQQQHLYDDADQAGNPQNELVAGTLVFRHQLKAVSDVTQHNFADNNNTALAVLPTGCGKTGIAVLASYALDASRVLVITPSLIITKQMFDAYCTEAHSFLLQRGIIKLHQVRDVFPKCRRIDNAKDILTAIREDSLVIINPHKVGAGATLQYEQLPKDVFDLVIVDEAHHYPAKTWKNLVKYFPCRKLFLTATPERMKGGMLVPILPQPPCYRLLRNEAIARGIIRLIDFKEVDRPENAAERAMWEPIAQRLGQEQDVQAQEEIKWEAIARRIEELLDEHDALVPGVRHQGMVITQTIRGLNPAEGFTRIYNAHFAHQCAMYVSGTSEDVLERFKRGEFRTLVIIGKLLEGFDRKEISVLGIVRNIAPASRVLFTQFVGRAVRKTRRDDPVSTAVIVTHSRYKQRANFDTLDQIAEIDPPEDPEDDPDLN